MIKYLKDTDVYFDINFAKATEIIEKGKANQYIYNDGNGQIIYTFIIRGINNIDLDEKYYDIITPYGYGGPIITACHKGMENELIHDFNFSFLSYCKENNIITEFIRFHPIWTNYDTFKDIYNPEYLRKTVGIDLTKNNIMNEELSSRCRNHIRKAEKSGVEIKYDYNCDTLRIFYSIYIQNMKKNQANDFYFFPFEYFERLTTLLNNHIFIANAVLDGKIIGTVMVLNYGDLMHTHLAATIPEYYSYSPHSLLYFKLSLWGQGRGKKYLHLGGGKSNDDKDSLLNFKKGFTKDTYFDFYIGKRIINQRIYNIIAEDNLKKYGDRRDYFPIYRK